MSCKKRKAQVKDITTGRFLKDQLSSKFITEYISFRIAFHENRPSCSQKDYGWYPQMVRDWPLWLEENRAESTEIPSRHILTKLWTSHQQQILHTPTTHTQALRKLNLYDEVLSAVCDPFSI